MAVHDLPSTARQSNSTKPLKIKLQNLPLRHLPLHVMHINVVFSLIRIPQEYTRTWHIYSDDKVTTTFPISSTIFTTSQACFSSLFCNRKTLNLVQCMWQCCPICNLGRMLLAKGGRRKEIVAKYSRIKQWVEKCWHVTKELHVVHSSCVTNTRSFIQYRPLACTNEWDIILQDSECVSGFTCA